MCFHIQQLWVHTAMMSIVKYVGGQKSFNENFLIRFPNFHPKFHVIFDRSPTMSLKARDENKRYMEWIKWKINNTEYVHDFQKNCKNKRVKQQQQINTPAGAWSESTFKLQEFYARLEFVCLKFEFMKKKIKQNPPGKQNEFFCTIAMLRRRLRSNLQNFIYEM